MKEAEQDRSAVVESTPGKTKDTVKRSKAVGTEIADDGSLVPRPGPFDRIEFGGVGWQPDEREPARFLFDEDLALLGHWLGVELDCENFDRITSDPELAWTASAPPRRGPVD